MEWKNWMGKRVFVKLKDGSVYNGLITDVNTSTNILVWITLVDKYNEEVVFVQSEIIKMVDESNKDGTTRD